MTSKRVLSSVVAITGLLGACSIVPRPLETGALGILAVDLQSRVAGHQDEISGAITFYEAMARALKYNLDYRVEMMQADLRTAELQHASLEMLPRVVANSSYVGRSDELSTGHLDIPSGIEVPPTTTSQDRVKAVGDFTFSWNVLDFALSYVRARQAADKVLIAEEANRKVIQRILEDTRTAYWRALSAEALLKKVEVLEARAQKAIGNARSLNRSGDLAPTAALSYERELVTIKQTMQRLARELNLARAQLAALMDVPPGTPFKLSESEGDLKPTMLGLSVPEMISEALFNRPELRDFAYQQRINEAEAYAAFLELLPGAQLFASENFDSNHYLLHGKWLSIGVTAAQNLIRVFQLPARRRAIAERDEVLDAQMLAMTMAIMTQVHVSRTRYRHFAAELATATEYHEVQQKLLAHMKAQAEADTLGEQTLMREEMNALVAQLRRDVAFVNLQNAAANVFVSMGLDLQAREIDLTLNVTDLTARLRAVWADRGAVSQRSKYILDLEAAKAEAARLQAEAARHARLEAEARAREEAREREADAARRRDPGGSIKDHLPGGLNDDLRVPRDERGAPKPYTGVK
jgi:outer membrane protein TolC